MSCLSSPEATTRPDLDAVPAELLELKARIR